MMLVEGNFSAYKPPLLSFMLTFSCAPVSLSMSDENFPPHNNQEQISGLKLAKRKTL